MFNGFPKTALLLVRKKETNYLIRFYIILYNFRNCAIFIDIKKNFALYSSK